jgi:hypothetical protein
MKFFRTKSMKWNNPPVTNLVFLGLEIDTIEMVIQIPHEKLIRLKSLLEPLLWNRRIQLKEFESIVGLMAFCSKALASSRAICTV